MKILIISHNSISTGTNMGKTMLSLFSSIEKNEICQIYVSDDTPDVDKCSSCFRITDKDALKSIFFRNRCGEETHFIAKTKIERKTPLIYKKRKEPVIRLLRDVIWSASNWYNSALKKWICKEKPECIFLVPGYGKFIYNIALKISRDYDIPIVTYICDDYYFTRKPTDVLGRVYWMLLRKKIKQTMEKNVCVIAICQEIKTLYEKEFGVKSKVCMTGASFKEAVRTNAERQDISFFGNISNNRYFALKEVAKEVRGFSDNILVNIYTPNRYSEYFDTLMQEPNIRIKGFVSEAEMKEEMGKAKFLLHVESFDEKNRDLIKHSVSTKIADSLVSGIPLIAYGPEEISSIKHLIRNDCAFVATSKSQLKQVLESALYDEKKIKEIMCNATKTGIKYHDTEKNSKELREVLEQVLSYAN